MNQSCDENEDTKLESALELLPAWFTERMMTDDWKFGLLTTTGAVITIDSITEVHQAANGELWIDVRLSDTLSEAYKGMETFPPFVSPTSRPTASIAVRHIVAAFELADT